MKKQLLAGAFILASFFAAQAQTTILSNNFGTDQDSFEEQTEGWGNYAFDTDEDYITFTIDDPDAADLGFTGVSGFSATFTVTGTEEDPIVTPLDSVANFYASPVIDLTTTTTAYMTIKLGTIGADDAVMGYQILVMKDADWVAETFTAETVFVAGSGTIAAGEANDVNIVLDGFTGENVRILILHDGTTSTGLGLLVFDDIVVADGVLATDKFTLTSLVVTPNPANDVVNIANDQNALLNGVVVTDLNGRTVKTAKFAGVSQAQVNVSDLASGVYMMTISSDKGSVTKKIVKN